MKLPISTLLAAMLIFSAQTAAIAQSSGTKAGGFSRFSQPSPLGAINCEERDLSSYVFCQFTPTESRKYVVDVLAEGCDRSGVVFEGAPKEAIRKEKLRIKDKCRILSAKVELTAGRTTTFSATSGNRLRSVWISIRKG